MSDDNLGARLLAYLKEKKSLWLIAAALLLGVLLIIYGNSGSGLPSGARAVSGTAAASALDQDDYEQKLEARVRTLCEQVGGVSDVSVMITLESMSEQLYAQNLESSESESVKELRQEYIEVGDSLVPTKAMPPSVRGVAIVCSGGDDANVQLKLTKLISALFGISSGAISVVGGK